MSNLESNSKQGEYILGKNPVIENLWLNFHSSEEGKWILGAESSILLHDKIKEFNPKQILELGTGIGCSTAIMAFACPDAHIYTIEQNQRCIDIALKLIPANFQERIYFKHLEANVTKPIFEINPFIQWQVYAGEFDWIDYDFIFVDGPGPVMINIQKPDTEEVWKFLADQPGGDILFLLYKMRPGTIIYVDKRKITTQLYNRHLCSIYENQKGYLERLEETRLHTIYRRTDLSLQSDFKDFINFDCAFGYLNSTGYFK